MWAYSETKVMNGIVTDVYLRYSKPIRSMSTYYLMAVRRRRVTHETSQASNYSFFICEIRG